MVRLFTLTLALMLLGSFSSYGAKADPISMNAPFAFQGETVRGRVVDQDGNPVVGATVTVVNNSNQVLAGTYTDADGRFGVTLPAGEGLKIRFSGVGYVAATFDPSANLEVTLTSDDLSLSETVVNAIGFEVQKNRVGYGTAAVNGGQVTASGEPNLISGLSGKATGLTIVQSTGDPGAGAYIQIRGQSTILSNAQPLIVVDGVPFSNSSLGNGVDGTSQQSRLNDINPNDIESVEIIKSAAGAALWGSRGANGVISITTKSGKKSLGRVSIDFTTRISIDEVGQLPKLQERFGQGNNGVYQFTPAGGRSWGDPIFLRSGAADVVNTTGAYVILPDGTRRYPVTTKNSRQTFNNVDDIFRTGYVFENSLNVGTATENSSIFFSASYLDQQGIILNNSDYDRYNFSLRGSQRVTKDLEVSVSGNYAYNDSKRIQQGSNLSGIFLGGLRTPADYDNTYYTGTYVDADGVNFRGRQVAYRNPLGASLSSVYDNPNYTINENTSNVQVNRFFGNVQLKLNITPWLQVLERIGLDTYSEQRKDYFAPYSAASGTTSANLVGSYTDQYIVETEITNDLILRADKQVSPSITVGGLLGLQLNSQKFSNVGGAVNDFVLPFAPPSLTNALPANTSAFNLESTIRRSAGYAQLDLGFFDQLFITATGRLENASNFGPEADKAFFYPSVSAAWEFSKLEFLAPSGFYSYGKLRASAGIVGVIPNGAYPFVNTLNPSGYDEGYGGTLNGAIYGGGYERNSNAANPFLTPERKKEVELGFDLRFLENRLAFSATGFYNITEDVIVEGAPLPPSSGFNTQTFNAGRLQNTGLELQLDYNYFKKGDWSATISANWTHIKNKVLDLGGSEQLGLAGFTDPASVAIVGQPLGTIYGNGLALNADGSYVLDAFGFPDANAITTRILGDPNPDWRMGIGNTVQWKQLSLYALFEFVQGADVWNGTKGALSFFGRSENTDLWTTVSAADAATIFDYNGNSIADVGTLNTDGTYSFRGEVKDFGGGNVAINEYWFRAGPGSGFTGDNSQFIEDASLVRLRELTIKYTLKSDFLKRIARINSADISVTGRNLALWTDYTGIDPETNLTGPSNGRGLDYFNNPNTRSYLLTLSLHF